MDWRKLLVIPPILVGIGIFFVQAGPSSDSDAPPIAPAPTPVRVVEIGHEPFLPTVSGFGRVAPVRRWEGISQVDGRIVELAEGLAVGTVVAETTPLVRIDPRDYEIAMARADASLASARAELTEIDAQERNTRALLAVEREIESFMQSELNRQQTLAQRGTISQAALEQVNRDLLNQQRQVLDLENQLALYPVQRITAEATIMTREVELEEAQRDLDSTTIAAPFRGRITEQELSVGEYVRHGDWLLTLEDTAAAEVVAEIQPGVLGAAMRAVMPDAVPTTLDLESAAAAMRLLRRFDLTATVHQTIGDRQYVWPATIDRQTGATDPETGTVGLVVRVDDPDRPDLANQRPPLRQGSFVEVRIAADQPIDTLMVDRSAVWTDADGAAFVYVMDADETLQRRPIRAATTIEDRVIVADGLAPGDIVVLSDPQPAVLGMALAPVFEDTTVIGTAQP